MTKLSIEELRKNIDAIDRQILDLLKKRADFVYKVGHIKKKAAPNESIMRPGREALIIKKVTAWPSGHMLKEAIGSIWRTIIAGSIAIEQKIKIHVFSNGDENIFADAKDYYGNFSNLIPAKSFKQLISNIEKSKTCVGVIPASGKFFFENWFIRFLNRSDCINIFAKLPYMQSKKITSSPSFVLGQVQPEPTGDDSSLLIIETPRSTKLEKVTKNLNLSGIKAKAKLLSENKKELSTYFLFEISDFIPKNDSRLKKFSLNNYKIYHLGSYANPAKL